MSGSIGNALSFPIQNFSIARAMWFNTCSKRVVDLELSVREHDSGTSLLHVNYVFEGWSAQPIVRYRTDRWRLTVDFSSGAVESETGTILSSDSVPCFQWNSNLLTRSVLCRLSNAEFLVRYPLLQVPSFHKLVATERRESGGCAFSLNRVAGSHPRDPDASRCDDLPRTLLFENALALLTASAFAIWLIEFDLSG